MRRLLLILPLALSITLAQAAPSYVPKFARVQQDVLLNPCAKPEYPKASRRNEETGSTTIRFAAAPSGAVTDLTVIIKSGYRDLDKAAVAALKLCRFTPAMVGGKPVQAIMLAQYDWGFDQ
ncbi:MAG: energy transducer TonB [Pseudomonadota bacterium]